MKKCQNCGFENEAAMNFCLNCGNPLDAAASTEAKTEIWTGNVQSLPTVQTPKKSNKKFWIFGSLAALLVIGAIGLAGLFYAASKFGDNTNTRKPINDSPTPKKKPTDNTKTNPTPEKSASPDNSNAETPDPNVANLSNVTDNPIAPDGKNVFSVQANKGWQTSDIDVVGNQKFILLALGEIYLRDIRKGVAPEGVSNKEYESRRIYKEFPTGALLMRTKQADGTYSKVSEIGSKPVGAVWQNKPNESGKLEFCINDNAPEGNSGEFMVSFAEMGKE